MASDFDKDEIKDASFPIEFKDDSVSLDMFGVWVKNGPRDAQQDTSASFADFADIPAGNTDEISETAIVAETDSFVDISDLPDLPDFGETAEEPVSETALGETGEFASVSFPDITFEEIVTETSEPVSARSETTDFSLASSTVSAESDISDIDLDTFLDESIESVKSESFEEKETDILEESSFGETRQEEATFTGFDEIDVVPFDESASEETISFVDEPAAEESPIAEFGTEFETESFSSFDASLSSGDAYTLSEAPLVSSLSGLREAIEQEESLAESDDAVTEVAADAVEDDFSGFLDDLNAGNVPDSSAAPAPAAAPAEDDFSSFLDDLNSSEAMSAPKPAGSPDDLDLDDFINSVNESGTSSKEEAEKVYSDTDPVNIELEFDESYIEDVQKIRATGATVSESEFFNSEFGVELIDETRGQSGTESFEAMFSAIPDSEGGEPASEPAVESSSFIEATSEFDDLLSSLDLAPAPAVAKSEPKSAAPVKRQGYDLVVNEEGNDTISATVSETSVDDDIVVSLSGTESAVQHEKKTPAEQPAAVSGFDASIADAIATEYGIDFEPGNEPVREEMPESGSDLSMDEELRDFFATDEAVAENPAADAAVTDETSPFSVPAEEENLDIPDIRDYNETNSGVDADNFPNDSMEDTVTLEFDDISAVEKDLNDFVPDAGESQVVTNDKSTELLMIIADELSSIKKEISTLKSEIAIFKPQQGDQLVEGAPASEHENSGFFTDDDTDETIALTGDELNNILITADFTEEKGPETEEPQGEPIPDSIPEPAGEENDADIAEFDTKTPEFSHLDFAVTEEPAGEPMAEAAESEPEIPDVLPDSILDVPEMDIPLAVEISHVTTMDEDTSYLEGSDVSDPDLDNVAIEEPELEIIDFEDEKLEEPELAEFNIDLTDISAELPAEQDVSVPEESVAAVTTESAPPAEAVSEAGESDFEVSAETSAPESTGVTTLPTDLKDEIKSVLSYMDQLLESLPEEKIEEFARSEHFEVYKKLFEELGIS